MCIRDRAYSSQGIIDLGTNIVVSDKVLTSSEINILNNLSTGIINTNSVTTLIGSSASINTLYGSSIDSDNTATDGVINLGNETIILSDSTIDASSLVSIRSSTSGTVFAGEVGTIKGSTDSINDLYDLYTNISSSSLGNESITITDKVGSSSALSLSLIHI